MTFPHTQQFIKYVHDFDTQDEYISYVVELATTRRADFDCYLSKLSQNSIHLLETSETDMRLHICVSYMLGVCKMVEYFKRAMH